MPPYIPGMGPQLVAGGRNVVPGRNYLSFQPNYGALLGSLEQQGLNFAALKAADAVDQLQDQFRILRAIVTPEEALDNPVRYKDEFNTEATAALGLLMNQKCNWQAQPINATVTTGVNQQVGPNDMFIATFNDSPFCIMVMYLPNAGFVEWKYNWMMNSSFTLRVGQIGGCIYHNKAQADPASLFQPHDIYLFSGQDKAKYRYNWVDATAASVTSAGVARPSTIVVTTLNTGATGAVNLFTLNLYRYLNGYPSLVDSAAVTSPGGSAPVTTTFNLGGAKISDYYAVTVTNVATGGQAQQAKDALAAGFNITSSGVCSSLGHFAVKKINAHLGQLSKSGRINALGVRLTDVAMYQYLNGEVAVITAQDGNAWYPLFQVGREGTTVLYDTVADYPGAIIGQLQDGAYTYHKPASKKDYDWKEWVVLDPTTGEVLDHWVPLETNSPVKVIAATTMNDNNVGSPNGQGAACYVTLSIIMEWKSLDDWTPMWKARESSVAWRDALEKLELFPDATGNAWHWQDMLHGISKVVKWTAPVWRAAIEAGGSALDGFDPGLGAAARTVGGAVVNAAINYGNRSKRKGR